MKSETIPQKEKFDQLVAGLAELEPLARELSQNEVHGQSPHIGSILGRVRGACESATWHTKFLAELPEPATNKTDAKAGKNPAK